MNSKPGATLVKPTHRGNTPSDQAQDEVLGCPTGNKRSPSGVIILDDHFRYLSDRQRAMALFKASVHWVEIEIHSYCNRTCAFCGNAFLDRRSHKTVMDPAVYSKIMDDLASIEFAGTIRYSGYNETTADRPLFLTRLGEARAKLPNARLKVYSNGDYLDADYIRAMRDAGLNSLSVMAYLNKGQEPTAANFLNIIVPRLIKLGLPWKFVECNSAEVEVPGLKITYWFEDFLKTGTYRGGSLTTGDIIDRKSPCTIPVRAVYVDYDGSMVPCCDIRSDFEKHKDFIVYKLTTENSIFEGYANSKLVEWRRDLTRFGEKRFPCNGCSYATYPETPEMQKMFKIISESADKIPLST